jgi:methyltransferase family protein
MALPDSRACFDYFRPTSTLAEILEAYFTRRDRPSAAQIFEQQALGARYVDADGSRIAFYLHDDPHNIIPQETLYEAFNNWKNALEQGRPKYVETHCWVFMASSFELIIRDLRFLGLISFEVVEVPTNHLSEFYVHLRSLGSEQAQTIPVTAFYEQRQQLLHQVNSDMGDNSLQAYLLRRRLAELESSLTAISSSTSWRMTAPLRAVSSAVRQLRRRAPQLRWNIDQCDARLVRGWIDRDGPLDAVLIEINGKSVATLSPSIFREDLRKAGLGDGHRAFSFEIAEYLAAGANTVSIHCGGTTLLNRAVSTDPPAMVPSGDPAPFKKFEHRAPSFQNAIDLFEGKWACDVGEVCPGIMSGAARLFSADPRPRYCADLLGNDGRLDGLSVLELGPLEGAHTCQLEKLGAKSILAIEANTEAFLKCLIVKEIAGLHAARFMLGDCAEYLATTSDYFDVVMCCGILYHMSDPVSFIQGLGKVSSKCFVWTHYYEENHYPGPLRKLVLDRQYPEIKLFLSEYRDAHQGTFWGGNKQISVWLGREDILRCFRNAGFSSIEVVEDTPDHPNGACFSFAATRT